MVEAFRYKGIQPIAKSTFTQKDVNKVCIPENKVCNNGLTECVGDRDRRFTQEDVNKVCIPENKVCKDEFTECVGDRDRRFTQEDVNKVCIPENKVCNDGLTEISDERFRRFTQEDVNKVCIPENKVCNDGLTEISDERFRRFTQEDINKVCIPENKVCDNGLTERIDKRDKRGIETGSEARYATSSRARYANRELEIEDSTDQEQNLQSEQPILSEIGSVGRKPEEDLVFESGQKNFDFVGFLGWSLPGHGEPYHDCGETLVFGCLNVEDHTQECLDKEVVGKVFLDLRKRACLRSVCPICYEKWAGKEAHKIEYRLSQWRSSGKAIHLMISVPRDLWHIPLEDLRPRIYKVARRVGFFGGSCIIHPFRQKCVYCSSPKDTFIERCLTCGYSHFKWEFSPHFHLIGFGWIRGDRVTEQYEKEGWITKNLGVRDSVLSTAHYQLSHCGIKEGKHSVTWFGRLAYNKLKVVPEIVEKRTCPICEADLVRLLWVGGGLCPYEAEGEYYDSPENWVGSLGWRGGG